MDFDYYIFIDYSEDFLGYDIIQGEKVGDSFPKISSKFYSRFVERKLHLKNISKSFKQGRGIYLDVLEFLKNHENCAIFVSVDNSEYVSFRKRVNLVDKETVKIIREDEFKKDCIEHKLSLVLDNFLNIKRLLKNDF